LSYLAKSSLAARDLLQATVQLAPKDVGAHFALGQLFADHGELEDAVTEFRIVADLAPGDGDSHFWIYLALKKLGRTAEADAELQRARELASEYAAKFLGRVEFSQREWN
jgi:Flp pilus assembly protein TadD